MDLEEYVGAVVDEEDEGTDSDEAARPRSHEEADGDHMVGRLSRVVLLLYVERQRHQLADVESQLQHVVLPDVKRCGLQSRRKITFTFSQAKICKQSKNEVVHGASSIEVPSQSLF